MDGKSSLSPQGELLVIPLGLISPGDIPGNTSQAAAGPRRPGKMLFPWPSVLPVGFQLPVLETEAVEGMDEICVPRSVKQRELSTSPAAFCSALGLWAKT